MNIFNGIEVWSIKNKIHSIFITIGFYQKKIIFDDKEFNEYFLVKTDQPSRLRECLTQDVIELLSKNRKLWIEGINYFLAIYQPGKFLPVQQISQLRETGYRILNLFKGNYTSYTRHEIKK